MASAELAGRRTRETTSEEDESFFNSLEERIQQVRYINVFVVSFSKQPDELSQWRAYCPPGKGVSLGFSSTQLSARAQEQGFRLVPVRYERSQHEQLVRELVDDAISKYRAGGLADTFDLTEEFGHNLATISPLLKDISFVREEEWRLVSAVTVIDHPKVHVREGHARIIPYFAFDVAYAGVLELTRVTAGPAPEQLLVLKSIWAANKVHGVTAPEPVASSVPFRPW